MSRRRLIGAAGAAGAAALGAAACGSPDEGPAPHDALRGTVVAQTSDIPVGGGSVVIDGKLVVTQPEKGDFKAFSAVCTHAGCTVQEVEATVNCLCHGSEFDIATGDVRSGPADRPLEELSITVDGTDIVLDEEPPQGEQGS
ncbi:iron-sulfur protein [Streptomonospora alba]|uniref:Cytochrome bc1 complex Rieske iron-sulfur subunit n=1 Tax=Streptomonospora alba TaxID=183763 RepID=A0A0C2G855_9ACTN|nr:Rieske (2Fe-2S) protein [Streptomonospora alba]KIH99478.1 iron-sulfur protein [Streptomonospora alba]